MDELQAEYKALNTEKEEIELKLNDLNEVLNDNAAVGMKEALVDGEGYPRSDIDVYSVRHARHQIICLQNDHKDVMKKLEEKLYQIHYCARKTQSVNNGYTNNAASNTVNLKPFLTVNQITPTGPAEKAGLKLGDKIKQFGSVSASNFRSLQDIALVVQHSKDKVVKLVIEREGSEYRLELTPHVWSGRGLLGCNVVELKDS